jgi:uncharacterized protein (DUF1800 family)
MDEAQQVAHLLRRAGFGANPRELADAVRRGYAATLDQLLDFASVPDRAADELADVEDALLDVRNADDVRTAWLFRMVRTSRPLEERLALFWHGHFATSVKKVGNAALMRRQIDLFRRHAAGNFRSLLLDVARDPAMLIWLDGAANRKGHANENFARELLELFTLGIGNYTEHDVREAARALTGWTVKEGESAFDKNQWDPGEKEILGKKGAFDAEGVIDILAAHPASAARLARKLCQEFLGPEPDAATVELLAKEFVRSGFEVRSMLRALFTSPAFVADSALFARVKSPVELAVGAMRALPGIVPLKLLPNELRRMGQDLLAPPTVKGWDGGTAWLSPGTMLGRWNFAKDVDASYSDQPSPALAPRELVREWKIDSAEKLVDHMLERLGPLEVTPTVRAKLVEYARTKEDPKGALFPAPGAIDAKVRGVAQLVMSLPEYQLA